MVFMDSGEYVPNIKNVAMAIPPFSEKSRWFWKETPPKSRLFYHRIQERADFFGGKRILLKRPSWSDP
jgi:hypothetical protein